MDLVYIPGIPGGEGGGSKLQYLGKKKTNSQTKTWYHKFGVKMMIKA